MKIQNLNIYINRFTGDCIPIIPFLGVLFYENGLSLSKISFVFLLLATSTFILEIPAGVLADRLSLKLVLLFSRITKFLAFVAILLLPNMTGACLGMILWGISSALDSGTFQAYLFMYAKSFQSERIFERLYSQSSLASLLGILSAAALGTQVDFITLEGLQYLGVCILGATIISTLLFKTTSRDARQDSEESFLTTIKKTRAYSYKKPLLISFIAIGILSGGVKGTLDEYSSLLLSVKGLSLEAIGYTLLALEGIKSSGAYISQWIKNTHISQIIILVLTALSFIGVGFSSAFIAILLLLLIMLLDAILWIHNDISIQKLADDSNRATIASIKNFGTEIIAAAVLGTMWLSGSVLSLEQIYILLGGIILIVFAITTFWIQKQTRICE